MAIQNNQYLMLGKCRTENHLTLPLMQMPGMKYWKGYVKRNFVTGVYRKETIKAI